MIASVSQFQALPTASDQTRATMSMAMRVGPMLLRGITRKPWLRSSTGPLYVGRRVRFSNSYLISHSGRLVLEDGVEIQGLSKRGIHFGDHVSIGAGTMIRPSSYYGGEVGEGLIVGDRSSMGAACFIGCSGLITIGNDVMLGPGVRVFSENHRFDSTDETIKSQGVVRGTVAIGDDCWIASGVTITANVTIGAGVVVAAGSVVTKDIPDYAVAAGAPARVIRSRR